MPMTHLKRVCDLVNNQRNLSDERAFKEASLCVICKVIGEIDPKDRERYTQLFEEKLNISQEELEGILQAKSEDLEAQIAYIKGEIGRNHPYEVMQFLRILNRFVMAHGCCKQDYMRFEAIRDRFIEGLK